jgi:hypothetical protein
MEFFFTESHNFALRKYMFSFINFYTILFNIFNIYIHYQLWRNKVEDKLHLGIREQRGLNIINKDTEDASVKISICSALILIRECKFVISHYPIINKVIIC